MFDLEESIREWKKDFRKQDSLEDGVLADMELLLRDAYKDHRRAGLEEGDAFRAAAAQVGPAPSIASAYRKNQIAVLNRRSPFRLSRFMPALVGNYIKVAFRKIRREKGYSFIYVAGLAVGIASCLLILSWVRFELSYDRFHTNAREIYRVISVFHSPGGEINYALGSQAPLAAALKNNYPEIINSARATSTEWMIGREENRFGESVWFVDPAFLDIFTFTFIQGDPATALSNPNSVILTETLAEKLFRNDNPIGKTVIGSRETPFIVSGVIRNISRNSHFDIDAIVHLEIRAGQDLAEWGGFNYRTYIQLQKGSSAKDVQKKIEHLLENYMPKTQTTIQLQPLTQIHLYALEGGGLIAYIYIFIAMALLILLIACLNYMSLSSAKAAARAKETGIRQVVGARREQLVRQFLGESLLHSLMATIIAIGLALLFLPVFQRLAGNEFEVDFSLETLALVVGLTAFTGILSGSYPAFVLSRIKPIKILKGIFRSGGEGVVLRKILVIVQFALSVFFIFGTLSINRQIHLLRNKNLGYDKENIICLDALDEGFARNYSVVKNKLTNNPHIVGMTVVDSFLDEPNSSATSDVVRWEGQKAGERLPWLIVRGVDYDFQKTFGIEMTEGRYFSRNYPSDRTDGMIVNEAAVKAMNMASPIGKKFHFWDYDGTIIGVIKDFHFRSLHKNIEPMVMKIGINLQRIAIRIKAEDMSATITFIEKEIKNIVPSYAFEYEFLVDKLGRLYRAERRMENITLSVSFLAIFLSCMGLVGLVAFTAEQKTKEIGIRKVLGASVGSITMMLYKDFLRWIIAANLIAWPLGFYFMSRWLRNFAIRINMNILMFILSSALVLFVALLTVSYQSVRAATAHPIDSMRYE